MLFSTILRLNRVQIENKNRHIGIVIACLLIFASVWRLPLVANPRIAFVLFFEIATLALFAVVLWRANKWFALFLMLAFVSSFFPHPGPLSYLAFRAVLYGLLWYTLIVHFVNTKEIQGIMDALCIIALSNTLFLIAQGFGLCREMIGFDLVYKPITGGGALPVGLMSNRNEVSCLLAFCLPAFFSRKKWKYFLPAIALGLILAHSTGGIVASSAGILFYVCMKRKFSWILLLLLIALVLQLFAGEADIEKIGIAVRWNAWAYALGLYKQHWLMGSGLGHWAIIGKISRPELYHVWWKTLHNEFLQGLFEMGIGFAIIAAGYALNIIRRFKKTALIPMMAIVVISVNSFVHFAFHIATTMMIAVTWLAILEVTLKEKQHGLSETSQ